MGEPRAKTAEEVRDELMKTIKGLAKDWADVPGKTPQERCDGVALSILAIIDGADIVLPAMDITLSPHPLDKHFCRSDGKNWYEPGMIINICQMHELYFRRQ